MCPQEQHFYKKIIFAVNTASYGKCRDDCLCSLSFTFQEMAFAAFKPGSTRLFCPFSFPCEFVINKLMCHSLKVLFLRWCDLGVGLSRLRDVFVCRWVAFRHGLIRADCRQGSSIQCWSSGDTWGNTCQLDSGQSLISLCQAFPNAHTYSPNEHTP